MLQAYQNRLHGRVRVRWHCVIGVRIVIANEFGLNLVVPSATAYFVDFSDEGSGAGWLNRCENEGGKGSVT